MCTQEVLPRVLSYWNGVAKDISTRPGHADSTPPKYTDDLRQRLPGRWSRGGCRPFEGQAPRPVEHPRLPVTSVIGRERVGANAHADSGAPRRAGSPPTSPQRRRRRMIPPSGVPAIARVEEARAGRRPGGCCRGHGGDEGLVRATGRAPWERPPSRGRIWWIGPCPREAWSIWKCRSLRAGFRARSAGGVKPWVDALYAAGADIVVESRSNLNTRRSAFSDKR